MPSCHFMMALLGMSEKSEKSLDGGRANSLALGNDGPPWVVNPDRPFRPLESFGQLFQHRITRHELVETRIKALDRAKGWIGGFFSPAESSGDAASRESRIVKEIISRIRAAPEILLLWLRESGCFAEGDRRF